MAISKAEVISKIEEALEEIKKSDDVDHFLLTWHVVDHMPFASIAPLDTMPIRSSMPLESLPELLVRMGTAMADQKPWEILT
jgi:hypothetical protein